MTCAERPPRPRQRTKTHVKKKKQVYDVCGAAISPAPENQSTRQKRKSKSATCAERPSRPRQRTKTHVKKKKQVYDVCGAAISPTSENKSTRQKEKASLRRVRSAHLARVREPKHTSKRKSKFMTCAERPSRPSRPKASVPCRPSPRWQQKSPTLQKPKPPQKFFPHPRDFRYNIRIGK